MELRIIRVRIKRARPVNDSDAAVVDPDFSADFNQRLLSTTIFDMLSRLRDMTHMVPKCP